MLSFGHAAAQVMPCFLQDARHRVTLVFADALDNSPTVITKPAVNLPSLVLMLHSGAQVCLHAARVELLAQDYA
jgi:hypothetical protein